MAHDADKLADGLCVPATKYQVPGLGCLRHNLRHHAEHDVYRTMAWGELDFPPLRHLPRPMVHTSDGRRRFLQETEDQGQCSWLAQTAIRMENDWYLFRGHLWPDALPLRHHRRVLANLRAHSQPLAGRTLYGYVYNGQCCHLPHSPYLC